MRYHYHLEKVKKPWIIGSEPFQCVSRRKRVTSTFGKAAAMSVESVDHLEDFIRCLTGWVRRLGRE